MEVRMGTIREEDWLTVKQAAVLKGVSERVIYKHIRSGKFTGRSFLGIQLVRKEHVEAWEVNQQKKAWGQQGGRTSEKETRH